MALVDRTEEFRKCARIMSGGAPVPKRRPRAVDGPTQFAQTAKRVGFTLRRAAGLVSQLHGLVQRRSLVFGDPTDQVEQLTTAIKTDRLAIEKGIEALLSAVPGSPRPRSHGAHCAAVIKVVRDQFIKQDMAFKAALETRSKNLKHQRARGQKFYNQPSAPQPQQHQGLAMAVPDFRGASARLEETRHMESQIAEIGQTMTRFADILYDQDQVIERIDENMDIVTGNVDAGQNELLKYYRNMSSDRKLIAYVFLSLQLYHNLVFMFCV
eukprot:g3071.t1